MTAAEVELPMSSSAPNTTWIDLAKAVFDLQVSRWDTQNCGGGLRWEIFTFDEGYDLKNSISTGTFFQLAARLARYTGNQTYTDWAEKAYDWVSASLLITSDFTVFDSVSVTNNCSDANREMWSYDAADFLYGSAVMYNVVSRS